MSENTARGLLWLCMALWFVGAIELAVCLCIAYTGPVGTTLLSLAAAEGLLRCMEELTNLCKQAVAILRVLEEDAR